MCLIAGTSGGRSSPTPQINSPELEKANQDAIAIATKVAEQLSDNFTVGWVSGIDHAGKRRLRNPASLARFVISFYHAALVDQASQLGVPEDELPYAVISVFTLG